MKKSTLAYLGILGAVGFLLAVSGSSKATPTPKPDDPIPPLPKIPDADISRAEFLVNQWERNPASVKAMNPAELRRLSGVMMQGGRGDLGAKLSVMAVLAEAPGQVPMNQAPMNQQPVDNRPAPGFLPGDLAARVSFLLNPAFEAQVTRQALDAAARDLEAFRGFDMQKDQLRRLRLRLGL